MTHSTAPGYAALSSASAATTCEHAVQGPGARLAPEVRQGFEARLGMDLEGVRVHSGPAAQAAAARYGARAFSIGSDIGFAAGEFAPHEPRGLRLLAHELVHVVQQRPGAAAPMTARDAPHEREADRLSEELATGGHVEVRQETGVAPAFALEDYMGRSPGTAEIESLSLSQLQDDIDAISEYLDRQMEGNETTAHLETVRDALRAQRRRLLRNAATDPAPSRRRRRRGGRRGRPQDGTEAAPSPDATEMPRILRERTSMPTEDPAEVRRELDRIVAWLQRPDVSAGDRQILRDEQATLAPQREQTRRQEASTRAAQRLQAAFRSTGNETQQLRQHVRAVESIYTDPGEPGVAFILHNGERHRIAAQRAQELVDTTGRQLTRAAQRAEMQAGTAMSTYRAQSHINEDSPVVSTIAGWVGGVDDPWRAVIVAKTRVDARIERIRALLGRGDYSGAVTPLTEAAESARRMERAVYVWRTGLIEGASLAADTLTFVRDASFAISTAIGAVVAAPLVAGAATAAGLTGTVGTVVTVGGTGLTVGGGAGAAGFGSEYAGQRFAGASHEQASAAATEQGKRRFSEGFAAGAGGATTRLASQALGVGGQVAHQTGRRVVAGAAGDFVGTTSGELLRGEDLSTSVGRGLRSSALGTLGTVGGARFGGSPGLQTAVETGIDTTVMTADVLAQGGSRTDVAQALTVSLATRGAMSSHPHLQRELAGYEAQGASLYRGARARVQAGARHTRAGALALGIGLADVGPAFRGGPGGSATPPSTVRQTATIARRPDATPEPPSSTRRQPSGGRRSETAGSDRRSPASEVEARDPSLIDLTQTRAPALELDTGTTRRTGDVEAHDPSLRTLDPGDGSALELDFGPPRQTAPALDPSLRDLGPLTGDVPEIDTRRRSAGPRRPRRRTDYGEPSREAGGTEHRSGTHRGEFNAAEVGPARLRIDFDPVAGRPRSARFRLTAEAVQSTQSSSRSFAFDPSTEGPQPVTGDFTGTGQDRGHLAPREAAALDPRFVADEFQATHAELQQQAERAFDQMTNVVPMDPDFNQHGRWRQAEQQANRWALQHGYVDVEIRVHYGDNPRTLPSGVPIPEGFIRMERAPNGRILRQRYYPNG